MSDSKTDHLNCAYISRQLFCDDFSQSQWGYDRVPQGWFPGPSLALDGPR